MSAASSKSKFLVDLQRKACGYFLDEVNPKNGLVRDSTQDGSPASIAAVGLALSAYVAAAHRQQIDRHDAIRRTLATLRFFATSPHGPERDATGYHGFYYHFLDMDSGRRARKCELSTIDTAILLAGMLTARMYYDGDTLEEDEIRFLADELYARADWRWALNGGDAICHGWKPERGFLKWRWKGYCEALILYTLALGSPTYSVPPNAYSAWLETYQWRELYGKEFLFAGPLFIHQLSHAWIDFRGIQDSFMREHDCDYFENSRRATLVQREYTTRNSRGFKGYGTDCWGITACDGPGPALLEIDGQKRRFYAYTARGVPFGPDDGTIAPWVIAASLPFAPDEVLAALRHINSTYPHQLCEHGMRSSFNATYRTDTRSGWVSSDHYGINQGPAVLMIENYRSDFFWGLLRECPPIVRGLRNAGFSGGWLGE
jgi:hypothetical protein